VFTKLDLLGEGIRSPLEAPGSIGSYSISARHARDWSRCWPGLVDGTPAASREGRRREDAAAVPEDTVAKPWLSSLLPKVGGGRFRKSV
jgi:hypothetical protein